MRRGAGSGPAETRRKNPDKLGEFELRIRIRKIIKSLDRIVI
jgi:hypothetical protein